MHSIEHSVCSVCNCKSRLSPPNIPDTLHFPTPYRFSTNSEKSPRGFSPRLYVENLPAVKIQLSALSLTSSDDHSLSSLSYIYHWKLRLGSLRSYSSHDSQVEAWTQKEVTSYSQMRRYQRVYRDIVHQRLGGPQRKN